MVTLDTRSSQTAAPPPAASDICVCPFTVLESSAEQLPWTFQGIVIGRSQMIVRRKRQYMKTADYSMEGLESRFLIERKADDLVSSVCGGHGRFEREHERMAEIIKAGGSACVIVEGCLSRICEELQADGRWKAKRTLLGCVASWPFKYGVPWVFAGSRRQAEELAFLVMMKWWEHSDSNPSS